MTAPHGEPVLACTLRVEIDELRSDLGQVLIYLYAQPDGFPSEPSRALRSGATRPAGGAAAIALTGLTPGEYALVAIHDEDDDGRLTTDASGLPRDGLAMSGFSALRGWRPDFEGARFAVTGPETRLVLRMQYLR